MIDGRIGADDEDHLGVDDVAHLIGDSTRVDALHERGHARRVTEARAVVDVVRAEPCANQLLKEIRLFVGDRKSTRLNSSH